VTKYQYTENTREYAYIRRFLCTVIYIILLRPPTMISSVVLCQIIALIHIRNLLLYIHCIRAFRPSSFLCLLYQVYSVFFKCFICVLLMYVMYVRLTHIIKITYLLTYLLTYSSEARHAHLPSSSLCWLSVRPSSQRKQTCVSKHWLGQGLLTSPSTSAPICVQHWGGEQVIRVLAWGTCPIPRVLG